MKILYGGCWYFFRSVFGTIFRCRIYNAERVPPQGPFILASNHASFFDPPLIGSSCPREISYLARESLFRYPVVGPILKAVNAIPVNRDGGGAAGLKGILDRLRQGGGIILFPEGTRTADGTLQPARSGIGLTVIKSEAPVVPTRVFGTFEAMSRHAWFPKPHPVRVKFGRPLYFDEERAQSRICPKSRLKEIYREVADRLMREIAKLEPCGDKAEFP